MQCLPIIYIQCALNFKDKLGIIHLCKQYKRNFLMVPFWLEKWQVRKNAKCFPFEILPSFFFPSSIPGKCLFLELCVKRAAWIPIMYILWPYDILLLGTQKLTNGSPPSTCYLFHLWYSIWMFACVWNLCCVGGGGGGERRVHFKWGHEKWQAGNKKTSPLSPTQKTSPPRSHFILKRAVIGPALHAIDCNLQCFV